MSLGLFTRDHFAAAEFVCFCLCEFQLETEETVFGSALKRLSVALFWGLPFGEKALRGIQSNAR